PNEALLQSRAKITLEIYTLAELQRRALAVEGCSIWAEPSVWDCPILPELSYLPDNLWLFDLEGNVWNKGEPRKFTDLGLTRKFTDLGQLSFVLQLEVIEESRKAHNAKRVREGKCTDQKREDEIRGVFEPYQI